MGFGKVLACIVGGAAAVIAAPVVLPAAAAIGGVAAAAGTAVAGAAATVGGAVASTAVGSAVIGAATTAGGVVASSAVGTAVAGAATAAAGAATAAGSAIGASAIGTAIAGTASTVGTTIASLGCVGAATAAEVGVAASIGIATTYAGITAGEGFKNMEEAKSTIEQATLEYKRQHEILQSKISDTNVKFEVLNVLKLNTYAKEIKDSIEIMKNIKDIKENENDFIEQGINFVLKPEEIEEMNKNAIEAAELVEGLAKSVSLMKASLGGSLGFVSQYGVASTGTAISELSGAAAKRATLAYFGGGALDAGGGGMALGKAVLGGITLLPTAMILSWSYAKNSEKSLTNAQAHHCKVRKEIEKIKSVEMVLKNGIDNRIEEISDTIKKVVDIYRDKVFPEFMNIYDKNKDNEGKVSYKLCLPKEKEAIKICAYFLKILKGIICVKVLDEQGNPSDESS